MRRIMTQAEYSAWLAVFMPIIPTNDSGDWLPLALVTDPTDGKLAHLDGLNISRAWMLEGMAAGLTPLIYNWIGAANLFHQYEMWSNINNLKKLLSTKVTFAQNRDFVLKNFDIKEKQNQMKNIIDSYIPLIEEKDYVTKNDQVAV